MPNLNSAATEAVRRMHLQPVCIWNGHGIENDLIQMGGIVSEEARAEQDALYNDWRNTVCRTYGLGADNASKPYAFSNGVAVIPVHGTLLNRFGQSWGFVTGYNFITRMTLLADADPDVSLIVYDHNSPGGEAAGCPEAGAVIAAVQTPTLSVVDSRAYSGSYWLASQADSISVIPSGGVGSIGALTMHVDMSEMMNNIGIKVTIISAGEHKAEGNPYEKLPDDVKKTTQIRLDGIRQNFAQSVADGRGMTLESVMATEAGCFTAEEALSLGLVDKIANPGDAIVEMLAGLEQGTGSIFDDEEDVNMPQENKDNVTTTKPVETVDSSAVITTERARIKAINTHEKAGVQRDVADYLAYDTTLSAEQCTAIMDKIAVVESKKPVETVSKDEQDGQRFKDAMDTTKNPEIKPEASNAGDQNQVDSILSLVPAAFKS